MTKPVSITDRPVFDLAAIGRELRAEDAYQRDGHTARTLVREPSLRVVLVVPPDLRHDVAALTDSALLLTLAWCDRR